jgi:hypothetical protein
MTDGTSESLSRVLFVERMVGQWLWVPAIARVVHGEVAGRAAIHAVEVRKEDLPNLQRHILRKRPLLRRCGPASLFLDELALVVLPFTVFVLVIAKHDQTADKEAQRGEPAIEFAKRAVSHVSDPP